MGEAFFWGIVASSSLILGGVVAHRVQVSRRILGLVMGFGAGVLISAVAYELVLEAFETSKGPGDVAFGLFAGCAVFSIGDALIDRMGGRGGSTPEAGRQRAPALRSCSGSSSTGSRSRSPSV